MATLQNIRNKAGLLVAIVIGLALFAFILGDMMGSGSSTIGKKSVAEINGKGIGVTDYMNREKSLANSISLMQEDNHWMLRWSGKFNRRHGEGFSGKPLWNVPMRNWACM
jgi:peptidyl-prolyl cis-trans isomerase D